MHRTNKRSRVLGVYLVVVGGAMVLYEVFRTRPAWPLVAAGIALALLGGLVLADGEGDD